MPNYSQEVTKEAIDQLPLIQFEGKIVIISDQEKIASAVKEIKKHPIVGFDTESRPAFKKGEYYPVSLLQIAIPEKVFLFRLQYTGFTKSLKGIFEDPGIIKTGISIRDDIKELKKRSPFEQERIVELNELAKQLQIPHAGVKKLAAIILGGKISKRQQTTNWENYTLTEKQKVYAATDAWVCLEIYRKLEGRGFLGGKGD